MLRACEKVAAWAHAGRRTEAGSPDCTTVSLPPAAAPIVTPGVMAESLQVHLLFKEESHKSAETTEETRTGHGRIG